MSSRRTVFAIAILGTAVALFVVSRRSVESPVPPAIPTDHAPPARSASATTITVAPKPSVPSGDALAPPAAPATRPLRPSKRSVVDLVPDPQTMRAEAEANPEVPSRALLSFAGEVGVKLDDAVQHPEKAPRLFAELADCATSPKLREDPSIQAMCLASANRLADQVPSLKAEARRLTKNVPPGIVRLSR